jgi:5-methylcytosine-specific restriction endonuclease McrA
MGKPYDPGKTAARGYGGRWQRERLAFLAQHPLCIMCEREGRVAAATVVDHIVPHKGDYTLMWAKANWQPLCKPHHDGDKQRLDKGGKVKQAIGSDGWPVT